MRLVPAVLGLALILSSAAVQARDIEYLFDARDQLVEVRDGDQTLVRFQYDGLGRLIKKIGSDGIRQYVYDADSTHVLTEYDEAGNAIAYYNWAADRLVAMSFVGVGVFVPTFDALGSVVALTDPSGNVVARYHYDAWGGLRFPSEMEAHPNRTGFTGHRWQPEVELYNANARYLDPATGRFITVDPHPTTPSDPATLHRYVYARNAPTRYSDPFGLWEWDVVLGGKATDAQLRQESANSSDRNRRKEIGQILNQREAFRYGLREAAKARDALPEGEDRTRVDRALAAYGSEGDPPVEEVVKKESGDVLFIRRMVVGRGDTESARVPADSSGKMVASVDEARSQLRFDMEARVTFRAEALTTEDRSIAQYVAHEGSHAADHQRLQAAVVAETRTGVALQPALGNPSVDLTEYETEREAYRVSTSIAQGQYLQSRPGRSGSSSPGGVVFRSSAGPEKKLVLRAGRDHTLWDADWRDAERVAKRDAAIDQYLAVGKPQGLYAVTPQNPGQTLSGTAVKREERP